MINEDLDDGDDLALRLYNLAIAYLACGDQDSAVVLARKATLADEGSEAYLWVPHDDLVHRLVLGNPRQHAAELLERLKPGQIERTR